MRQWWPIYIDIEIAIGDTAKWDVPHGKTITANIRLL
jgi:hypothetical protein